MTISRIQATTSRRIGVLKIALLSFLPFVNQVLPGFWFVSFGTGRDRESSLQQLAWPGIPLQPQHSSSLDDYWPIDHAVTGGQPKRNLAKTPHSKERPKPRVVHYSHLSKEHTGTNVSYFFTPLPHLELEFQDHTPPSYPTPKSRNNLCSGYRREECKAPNGGRWQAGNSPTCNILHEIDLSKLLAAAQNSAKLVGKGGKRMVWKVADHPTTANATISNETTVAPVALKMFKWRKNRAEDFGPQPLEYQRRDAVIHQATAFSPFIVDIHAFCGASTIQEFADGGDLESNIQKSGPLQGHELLETAYRMAAALKDLHQVKSGPANGDPPKIAHNDLYGSQYVLVNGQYKLTDFNLAKFLVRNRTTNEILPFNRDVIDNWFAPEVHRQHELKENIVTEKHDIWGLGNVLYLALTGLAPFDGMHRSEVHKLIMERTQLRPVIPYPIRASSDYPQKAVIKAIDMCMMEDPNDRPAAWEVAAYLNKALVSIQSYASMEELNGRSKRFPSIQDRVKHYMAPWYSPPCPGDPNAVVRYQILPPASGNSSTSSSNSVLIKALAEEEHIIKLEAKMQTDNAMMLEPSMLDTNGTHAGYRADVRRTIVPFWKALRGKPLITQWGDKTSFVVSSLEAPEMARAQPPTNIPHLKKCREVLSKEQVQRLAQPSGSCYGMDRAAKQPSSYRSIAPIIWMVDSNRLYGNVPLVPRNDKPWHEKQDKAIFRGRLTGNALYPDRSVVFPDTVTQEQYCRYLKRCLLVLKTHNSTTVDARLTEMRHKPLNTTIAGVPLLGQKMGLHEFLDYKVLIILEGNDVASGLSWSLRSNSVVMMPPPTWSAWLLEELLEPWVHYIPLDPSLDDVEEKMQWVLDHDEEAQHIARRASLWIMDLMEHPDSESDNEEIYKRMLHRYQKHFVFSRDMQNQYTERRTAASGGELPDR